jgi:CRP-like cAMP-binding protein
MAKKSDGAMLASVPLFEGLSKRELGMVRSHLREEWFNPGEDIVTQGDTGDRFYVIIEGRAKVIVNGRTRRTIGPGGFFGEMSLLDGSTRNATVRAETGVKTLWVGQTNFRSLLRENWSITQKVLADLCARIRSYDSDYSH